VLRRYSQAIGDLAGGKQSKLRSGASRRRRWPLPLPQRLRAAR
jgi:hypothetical protein